MRRINAIAIVGLFLLVMPSMAAAAGSGLPSNSPPKASQITSRNYETPVPVTFYVNGFLDKGVFNFSVPPGSHSTLNITATYPWYEIPAIDRLIVIQYSLAPFPLSSSVPDWLSLTMPSSLATMANESSSSSILHIEIGGATQDGVRGSFALHALYTDPLTSTQVLEVIVFNITADSASSQSLPSTPLILSNNHPVISPLTTSSWALGAGLCDKSSTNPCGGVGIQWSSTTGVETTIESVPSFTESYTTYITLNAWFASGYLFQLVLAAPSSGSTWQESGWVLYPSGPACHFNTNTVTAGTLSWLMQIEYVGSPFNTWYFGDSQYSYQISSHCTLTSSTNLYSWNQEPFAFESFDTTGSNFNGLLMGVNPAFEYLYSGTWYNVPGAYVVNSNNANSWGNKVIGGGSSTPSVIGEGGHLQLSTLGTYELDLGYNLAYGTQTYGTRLMT